ncbi:hypothetical protein QBK93_30890 [Rhizobium leguminosarum]|uniref:hypothetical protein n=1 Tax=Rhizobium leguminosarum TaxID=384 RepID=UPI0024A834F0|nr:hypothetical protein [Rhizobium leguminosarum]MDI5929052.1 hypothetical protein [Rhizobium leguminosarum]
MSWQVAYALKSIHGVRGVTGAENIRGDAIKITAQSQPESVAVISDADFIDVALAKGYHQQYPEMDFLCGYRKGAVWEGAAIKYLEGQKIGWGNSGTLTSAIQDDNVKTAAHKEFFFSDRLIRQLRCVASIDREFDRIHSLTLANGRTLRIGMVMEYEPTAEAVRTLWDRFGAVDVIWNINPNGKPTQKAIEAGEELGCKVMKWDELKALLKGL